MNTVVLILIAAIFLIWSIFKSKEKTKESLILSKNLLVKTFVEIIGVMALVGLVLAILPPELIKQLLGNSNEFLSTVYGAVIGALTIIPAFIAFPLSKSLYQSGANLTAISAFITTLTMVGFATIPIEIKYFGKKFTLHRLWISFVAAILIASGMAVIL
ncbi:MULTISPECIES: permease [unclassified Marinitoga]|uniref:permease n=1 Tax=unclassified Marinitoga TaxID=2640159 RepID=UPI0006414934|nr:MULTISPECIES: permease [unclassified Marinitoga]KLO23275.1 permease [Marinitoga sp. 1155]NUV00407.1 permease [Marinitoga sp. 1154]